VNPDVVILRVEKWLFLALQHADTKTHILMVTRLVEAKIRQANANLKKAGDSSKFKYLKISEWAALKQ